MRRRVTAMLVATALALVPAPSMASETSTPRDGPPSFPQGTGLQFDEGSAAYGEFLVLDDVRVGNHEGYDRIVVDFTRGRSRGVSVPYVEKARLEGTGRTVPVPGWTVQYAEQAMLEGSGEIVPLAGDTVLSVFASRTSWPHPNYYDGPRRLRPANGGDVAEVYVAGTWEGGTHVLVGIDGGARPFRVFPLSDPTRLVIDVRAPASGR